MNKKKILTLMSLTFLGGVSITDAKTGFYVGAEGGVNFLRLLENLDVALKSRAGNFGIFAGYGHQYPSTFYLGFQVGGGINFAKQIPESIRLNDVKQALAPLSNSSESFKAFVNSCDFKSGYISLTVNPNVKYCYNVEAHIGYFVLPKMLVYVITGIEGKMVEFGGCGILNTSIAINDSYKDMIKAGLKNLGKDENKIEEFLKSSVNITGVVNISGKDETIEGFSFSKTDMKKTNVFLGVLGLGAQYSITKNIDLGCAVKAKLGLKNNIKISEPAIKLKLTQGSEQIDLSNLIKDLNSEHQDVNINEMKEEWKKFWENDIEAKILLMDYSVALSLRYRF